MEPEGKRRKKPTTKQRLLGIGISEKCFEGDKLNLTGQILRGPLVRTDFTGADAEHAVFDYADLRGAIFNGANLRRASFKHAKLQGAQFIGANLAYANFAEASCSHADFTKAEIFLTDLRGTDLRESAITDIQLSRAHSNQLTLVDKK